MIIAERRQFFFSVSRRGGSPRWISKMYLNTYLGIRTQGYVQVVYLYASNGWCVQTSPWENVHPVCIFKLLQTSTGRSPRVYRFFIHDFLFGQTGNRNSQNVTWNMKSLTIASCPLPDLNIWLALLLGLCVSFIQGLITPRWITQPFIHLQ